MSQKIKVACENCRTRKKKCDGQLPCNSCIQFKNKSKRFDVPPCVYKTTMNLANYYNKSSPNYLQAIPNVNPLNAPILDLDDVLNTSDLNLTDSNQISAYTSWSSFSSEESLNSDDYIPNRFGPYTEKDQQIQSSMILKSAKLMNFGNIYDEFNFNGMLNSPQSYNVVCDQIHKHLLKSLDWFACGSSDDGYKLLYFSYITIQKYELFSNMKFNFTSEYPNKSPIVPFQTKLPPKSCENTLQLNALLAVLLKVDSLMSLINGTVCVLESEQLEPVKPILESPVISINKANPVMNHSHWIKTESGSGITPKMLDTHLQNLRVVRNIIHFHLDQKTMYQHKELLVIVFNFHNSCLQNFNDIPNTFKPFLSLDEFLNGIPCQVAKPYTDLPISQLPTRTHLACLAMLHTTAIRNGISESYSFQYLEPGVSYSSHDILLLTIRALGYIHTLKGSAIPIQHSLQVTITSISALFISRKVLEGLSIEPINIPYRQEAIHIIRNIIYNDVQQNSWQYPMISNVSFEFRKLLGINFSGTESMTDTYVTFNQPHIQQPQPYMNFHWNILQSSAVQDV